MTERKRIVILGAGYDSRCYRFSRSEAQTRNALPVPSTLYGDPSATGAYGRVLEKSCGRHPPPGFPAYCNRHLHYR